MGGNYQDFTITDDDSVICEMCGDTIRFSRGDIDGMLNAIEKHECDN